VGNALTDQAARLYALPPEEFVPERTAAARAARDAGDRRLAAAITRLRKPTVGAWLCNLLAHRCPDQLADLLRLGERLRRAQRELRGDELRALSAQRRERVDALARQAAVLARSAGRRTGAPLPLAEVVATLNAALADEDVAGQLRAGQLVRTVAYAGFGETPRPQLRLLAGGGSATIPLPDHRPRKGLAPAAGGRPTGDGRSSVDGRPSVDGRSSSDSRSTGNGRSTRDSRSTRDGRPTAARRELLAARTRLAEAEAARTRAEHAADDARRRFDRARAELARITGEPGGPDTGRDGDPNPG